MDKIKKAFPWAGAILMVAGAEAMGWIADDAARTMFAVLPALAVVSLYSSGPCFLRRGS